MHISRSVAGRIQVSVRRSSSVAGSRRIAAPRRGFRSVRTASFRGTAAKISVGTRFVTVIKTRSPRLNRFAQTSALAVGFGSRRAITAFAFGAVDAFIIRAFFPRTAFVRIVVATFAAGAFLSAACYLAAAATSAAAEGRAFTYAGITCCIARFARFDNFPFGQGGT